MAVRAGAAVAGAAVVAVLSAALALYGPPLDAGTRPRVRAGAPPWGPPGVGGRRVTPRARPRLPKRREEEQGEPDERVLGAHESVEPFFTRSVGLGPPLSRRRGEPPALRRGEEGTLSQAPPRGAGTGDAAWPCPSAAGPRGGAVRVLGTPVPQLLRSPGHACPGPSAPRTPPPPRLVWRYFVGRCFPKIHTFCYGLSRFLFESEVSSLGRLAELFTRKKPRIAGH